MVNTFLRLTALSILLEKLRGRPRQSEAPPPSIPLSVDELDRRYGVSGEVLLKHMDTFQFAPGAVDEMMAAVDATFEREPEGAN